MIEYHNTTLALTAMTSPWGSVNLTRAAINHLGLHRLVDTCVHFLQLLINKFVGSVQVHLRKHAFGRDYARVSRLSQEQEQQRVHPEEHLKQRKDGGYFYPQVAAYENSV